MAQDAAADHQDNVRSHRLDLRIFDENLVRAFTDSRLDEAAERLAAELEPGWPDAHDEAFLRCRLEPPLRHPAGPWGVWALVVREPARRMLGHAGFHGPPGENALGLARGVEIGYTVFPSFRGQGYAVEAAGALIEWARRHHGIAEFVASVAPANAASAAVVHRLGFLQVGEREDEVDGLELVYLLNG